MLLLLITFSCFNFSVDSNENDPKTNDPIITTTPEINVLIDTTRIDNNGTYDFGNFSTTGDLDTREVTIKNIDIENFEISGISLATGTSFSLSDLPSFPVLLDSGDSITIKIIYDPSDAGEKNDVLTLKNNFNNSYVLNIKSKSNDSSIVSKIYWLDITDSKIKRKNLDGTGSPENIIDIINISNDYSRMKIDIENDKIYWTEENGYYCDLKRSNIGGDINSIETIASGLFMPFDFAVNSNKNCIYWTNSASGEIHKNDFSGNTSILFDTWNSSGLFGIYYCKNNDSIYCTTFASSFLDIIDSNGNHKSTIYNYSPTRNATRIIYYNDIIYYSNTYDTSIRYTIDLNDPNVNNPDKELIPGIKTKTSSVFYKTFLDIDQINKKIYFTDKIDGDIKRADINGHIEAVIYENTNKHEIHDIAVYIK